MAEENETALFVRLPNPILEQARRLAGDDGVTPHNNNAVIRWVVTQYVKFAGNNSARCGASESGG